jgi:hypothetical protein
VGFTPVTRDDDLDRVGGWGLHLTEQLTSRWGTYEGSTHVWFEIHFGVVSREWGTTTSPS